MAPNLKVRNSQHTGTAFIGLHMEKITYMYVTRNGNTQNKCKINGS